MIQRINFKHRKTTIFLFILLNISIRNNVLHYVFLFVTMPCFCHEHEEIYEEKTINISFHFGYVHENAICAIVIILFLLFIIKQK